MLKSFALPAKNPTAIPRGHMLKEQPELRCSICGNPGVLRHYPGPVPVSSVYCDMHYSLLQRGYDPTVVARYQYFRGPTERADTYSDVMAWYEYHGQWCTRQIEQFEDKTYKASRDSEWAKVSECPLIEIDKNDPDFPLTEISRDEFESLWSIATPEPEV